MRLLLVVVGIIVLLMGSVWAFQGAGYIPGSFMTNDPTWIAIGAPTAAVGALLGVSGLRAKKPPAPQPPA
ncbi:MAG TPA: hypothetical protein VK723_07105 [Thermoplasmata archaeon]|nr:hypothetical protein [Thermoplasmata archaeon]